MKPSDFFIGVIDFFSVLLPGALLTFVLKGMCYGSLFGEGKLFPVPTAEITQWATFLTIAYIIGNLIFMVASRLDRIYDKYARKRWFQSKEDVKYKAACQIREKFIVTDVRLRELLSAGRLTGSQYQDLLTHPDRELFNTFKWAQHFLLFNKAEALADIHRTEADSKFFRSLVVTFFIIAVLLFAQMNSPLALVFLALALLCYYRYGELRFKATEKAYEMIITFFYQKSEDTVPGFDSSAKPQSTAALETDLHGDFLIHHHGMVRLLCKGHAKPPKRITIAQEVDSTQRFISEQNNSWYCLHGRGSLQILAGNQSVKTILLPNAIVPVAKADEFSLSNDGKEPIEILAFETSMKLD